MTCQRVSWEDLLLKLEQEFRGSYVDIDRVKDLMSSYTSCKQDWSKFAIFDHYRYTRNLVNEGNEKFNLILLCWGEGQGSSIHDHADSHCFMKVLSGELKETMYEWPVEGYKGPLCLRKETLYSTDQVAYIDDSIGLHRVENVSHTEKAVSLHLYSPPINICQTFDERSAKRNKCRVVFHSRGGCVCPPV